MRYLLFDFFLPSFEPLKKKGPVSTANDGRTKIKKEKNKNETVSPNFLFPFGMKKRKRKFKKSKCGAVAIDRCRVRRRLTASPLIFSGTTPDGDTFSKRFFFPKIYYYDFFSPSGGPVSAWPTSSIGLFCFFFFFFLKMLFSGFIGFYWVLLGFTGFYWVLPSFTVCLKM